MDACLNSVLEIAFEDADDEEHEQLHFNKDACRYYCK